MTHLAAAIEYTPNKHEPRHSATLPDGYPIKFCPSCKAQMFPREKITSTGEIDRQSPAAFKNQLTCSHKCGIANRAGKLSGLTIIKTTDKTRADMPFVDYKPGLKQGKAIIVTDERYEEYWANPPGLIFANHTGK